MTYQGSPYEPKFRAVRVDPSALPTARLRRLGLSDEELALIESEWETMNRDERAKTAGRLALLTDDEAREALRASRAAPKAAKATKRTRKASG